MSSQANQPLPEGFQLENYRVLRVLASGGFSFVYLAHDENEAPVAIKEYLPRDFAHRTRKGRVEPTDSRHAEDYAWGLDRFKREARALARFKHPNIVRVARMLEANNTAYMVMEFEVGLTLSEYLRGHASRLTEAELLGVFIPILDGLEHLHAVDVIHRDIKPGNIYLRREGPMLLDFGAARQMAMISSSDEMAISWPSRMWLRFLASRSTAWPWESRPAPTCSAPFAPERSMIRTASSPRPRISSSERLATTTAKPSASATTIEGRRTYDTTDGTRAGLHLGAWQRRVRQPGLHGIASALELFYERR